MADITTQGRIVRKSITAMTWATGAGHAAQTETMKINGTITRIILKASSVTDDPDVTLTLTEGELSATIFDSGAKDDGATYVFDTALDVAGTTTISVDPSADAGGAAQTLTVNVTV